MLVKVSECSNNSGSNKGLVSHLTASDRKPVTAGRNKKKRGSYNQKPGTPPAFVGGCLSLGPVPDGSGQHPECLRPSLSSRVTVPKFPFMFEWLLCLFSFPRTPPAGVLLCWDTGPGPRVTAVVSTPWSHPQPSYLHVSPAMTRTGAYYTRREREVYVSGIVL